jgi:hypothetical protein
MARFQKELKKNYMALLIENYPMGTLPNYSCETPILVSDHWWRGEGADEY